jgi:hypothetical protein
MLWPLAFIAALGNLMMFHHLEYNYELTRTEWIALMLMSGVNAFLWLGIALTNN